MAEEDKERRTEELDALRSFYEDDLLSGSDDCWRIRITRQIALEIHLLENYPSLSSPKPELVAPSWALDEGRKADVIKELEEMILPDTEMGILWAEHCRAEFGCDNYDDKNVNKSTEDESTTSSPAADPQHVIIAVIEFHHMLIGQSHKKESQALSAAASNGVLGYIYMGGPSYAVVKAMHKGDLVNWLQECKKASKPGNIGYWKTVPNDNIPIDWPNKLKIMGYTSGKGEKPDMESYTRILSQLDIPYPLPTCPD